MAVTVEYACDAGIDPADPEVYWQEFGPFGQGGRVVSATFTPDDDYVPGGGGATLYINSNLLAVGPTFQDIFWLVVDDQAGGQLTADTTYDFTVIPGDEDNQPRSVGESDLAYLQWSGVTSPVSVSGTLAITFHAVEGIESIDDVPPKTAPENDDPIIFVVPEDMDGLEVTFATFFPNEAFDCTNPITEFPETFFIYSDNEFFHIDANNPPYEVLDGAQVLLDKVADGTLVAGDTIRLHAGAEGVNPGGRVVFQYEDIEFPARVQQEVITNSYVGVPVTSKQFLLPDSAVFEQGDTCFVLIATELGSFVTDVASDAPISGEGASENIFNLDFINYAGASEYYDQHGGTGANVQLAIVRCEITNRLDGDNDDALVFTTDETTGFMFVSIIKADGGPYRPDRVANNFDIVDDMEIEVGLDPSFSYNQRGLVLGSVFHWCDPNVDPEAEGFLNDITAGVSNRHTDTIFRNDISYIWRGFYKDNANSAYRNYDFLASGPGVVAGKQDIIAASYAVGAAPEPTPSTVVQFPESGIESVFEGIEAPFSGPIGSAFWSPVEDWDTEDADLGLITLVEVDGPTPDYDRLVSFDPSFATNGATVFEAGTPYPMDLEEGRPDLVKGEALVIQYSGTAGQVAQAINVYLNPVDDGDDLILVVPAKSSPAYVDAPLTPLFSGGTVDHLTFTFAGDYDDPVSNREIYVNGDSAFGAFGELAGRDWHTGDVLELTVNSPVLRPGEGLTWSSPTEVDPGDNDFPGGYFTFNFVQPLPLIPTGFDVPVDLEAAIQYYHNDISFLYPNAVNALLFIGYSSTISSSGPNVAQDPWWENWYGMEDDWPSPDPLDIDAIHSSSEVGGAIWWDEEADFVEFGYLGTYAVNGLITRVYTTYPGIDLNWASGDDDGPTENGSWELQALTHGSLEPWHYAIPAINYGDDYPTVGTAPWDAAVAAATFTPTEDWTPEVDVMTTVEIATVDTDTTTCYLNLSSLALAGDGTLHAGVPYDMEVYDLEYASVPPGDGETPVTEGESLRALGGGTGGDPGFAVPAGLIIITPNPPTDPDDGPPPEPVMRTVTYTVNPRFGGTITGDTEQTVEDGEDATEVTAVAADFYQFERWSDDSTNAARTDTAVTEDLTFEALFSIKAAQPLPEHSGIRNAGARAYRYWFGSN